MDKKLTIIPIEETSKVDLSKVSIDLIKALDKSDEPNRRLDHRIFQLFFPDAGITIPPLYTASLNDVTALWENSGLCENRSLSFTIGREGSESSAMVGHSSYFGHHINPITATLIALIKAKTEL